MPHQVAGPVHRRCVVVHGPPGVGDGGQHLVVDPDPLGGPAGGLGVVGRDERDRFALVADELRGQHRLVGVLETEGVLPRDVVGGEDRVTPGTVSASVMSMPRMRACGCGLRSVTPQTMSSCQRSLA